MRHLGAAAFQPFVALPGNDSDLYFARELGAKVRETSQIGWSPENPGKVIAGRRQTYLEPDFQPFAGRHHAGPPRRAQR